MTRSTKRATSNNTSFPKNPSSSFLVFESLGWYTPHCTRQAHPYIHSAHLGPLCLRGVAQLIYRHISNQPGCTKPCSATHRISKSGHSPTHPHFPCTRFPFLGGALHSEWRNHTANLVTDRLPRPFPLAMPLTLPIPRRMDRHQMSPEPDRNGRDIARNALPQSMDIATNTTNAVTIRAAAADTIATGHPANTVNTVSTPATTTYPPRPRPLCRGR